MVPSVTNLHPRASPAPGLDSGTGTGLRDRDRTQGPLLLAVLLSIAAVASLVIVIAVPWVGIEMLSERETSSANGAKIVFDRATTQESATQVGALLQERGVLTGPSSGAIVRSLGTEHEIILTYDDPHAHEASGVQKFYRDIAGALSRDPFHGDPVVVIFQTGYGVELARFSSR